MNRWGTVGTLQEPSCSDCSEAYAQGLAQVNGSVHFQCHGLRSPCFWRDVHEQSAMPDIFCTGQASWPYPAVTLVQNPLLESRWWCAGATGISWGAYFYTSSHAPDVAPSAIQKLQCSPQVVAVMDVMASALADTEIETDDIDGYRASQNITKGDLRWFERFPILGLVTVDSADIRWHYEGDWRHGTPVN